LLKDRSRYDNAAATVGREVVKALGSFGFQIVSIRGSHAKLRRILVGGEHQTLTVALHKRLRPGMLHALFSTGFALYFGS
jgi:predicted RNA binding protein YcfA (HicA-like mRNA interferase family)